MAEDPAEAALLRARVAALEALVGCLVGRIMSRPDAEVMIAALQAYVDQVTADADAPRPLDPVIASFIICGLQGADVVRSTRQLANAPAAGAA